MSEAVERKFAALAETGDAGPSQLLLEEYRLQRAARAADLAEVEARIRELSAEIEPLRQETAVQQEKLDGIRAVSQNQNRLLTLAKTSFSKPTSLEIRDSDERVSATLNLPVAGIAERREGLLEQRSALDSRIAVLQHEFDDEMLALVERSRQALDGVGESVRASAGERESNMAD